MSGDFLRDVTSLSLFADDVLQVKLNQDLFIGTGELETVNKRLTSTKCF